MSHNYGSLALLNKIMDCWSNRVKKQTNSFDGYGCKKYLKTNFLCTFKTISAQ